MTTTPSDYELIRCNNCGRYGWHTTGNCPEPPNSPEPPAGATIIGQWQDDEDGSGLHRYFCGEWDRPIERDDCRNVDIYIGGYQYPDGRAERWVTADHAECLSPAEARQLARLLLTAAEEIDRLDEIDGEP